MMQPPTHLLRAIRRARRREMLGRVADAWFLAALLSAAGLILMFTRDVPRLLSLPEWGLVLIALTIVLGLWRVLTQAFDAFSVASRLDGLNRTNDVLATAYGVRESDDPWSRSLVAQAERASQTLVYPRAMGSHSLRAHLAAAAVVMASAICMVVFASPSGVGSFGDPGVVAIGPTLDPTSSQLTRVGTGIRRPGEATSETPQANRPEAADSTGQTGSDTQRTGAGTDAAGEGRSNSGTDTAMVSNHSPDHTTTSTGQTPSPGSGREGSGDPGGSNGTGTSDTAARSSASPWTSDDWSASRQAAIDAVTSKDVPQDRRALVRAYFER